MIGQDKEEPMSDDLHYREYQLYKKLHNYNKDSYEVYLKKREVI